jgi:hypothetical protein
MKQPEFMYSQKQTAQQATLTKIRMEKSRKAAQFMYSSPSEFLWKYPCGDVLKVFVIPINQAMVGSLLLTEYYIL